MSDCETTAGEGGGYSSDVSVISNTTQGTEHSPHVLCGLNMLVHTAPKRRKVTKITHTEVGSPVIPSQNFVANVRKTEDIGSNREISDNESVQSELLLADSKSRLSDGRHIPRQETEQHIKNNRDTVSYNPTEVLDDLFTGQKALKSNKHEQTLIKTDREVSKNLNQDAPLTKSSELQPSTDQTGEKSDQIVRPSQESTSTLDHLLIATTLPHCEASSGQQRDQALQTSGSGNSHLSFGPNAILPCLQPSTQSCLSSAENVTGISSSSTTNLDRLFSGQTSVSFEVEPKSAYAIPSFGLTTSRDLVISSSSAPEVNSLSSTPSSGQTSEVLQADQPLRPGRGPSTVRFFKSDITETQVPEEHLSSQLLDFIVEFSQVSQTKVDSKFPSSPCKLEDASNQNITPSIPKSRLTETEMSPLRLKVSPVLRSAVTNNQSGVVPSPAESIRSGPLSRELLISPQSKTQPHPESKRGENGTDVMRQSPRDMTTTSSGGTARVASCSDADLKKWSFEDKKATSSGGTARVGSCSDADLKKWSFEDKKATSSGGTARVASCSDADSSRDCIQNNTSSTPGSGKDTSDGDFTKKSPQKNQTHTVLGHIDKTLFLTKGIQSNGSDHCQQLGKYSKQASEDRVSVNSSRSQAASQSKQTGKRMVQREGEWSLERTAVNWSQDSSSVKVSQVREKLARSKTQIDGPSARLTEQQESPARQVDSYSDRSNDKCRHRSQMTSPSVRASGDVSSRSGRQTDHSPARPTEDRAKSARQTPSSNCTKQLLSQEQQMPVISQIHLNISQMKTRYQTLRKFLRQRRDSNTLLCLSSELDQIQTQISSLNEEHKAERSCMFMQVSQLGMSRSQRKQLKMRLQDLGARQKQLVEVVQSHKEVKGQVKQQLSAVVRENTLASVRDVNRRERKKHVEGVRGTDCRMPEETRWVTDAAGLPAPVYEKILEMNDEKTAELQEEKKEMDGKEKHQLKDVQKTAGRVEANLKIDKQITGLPTPLYEKLAEIQAEKRQSIKLKEPLRVEADIDIDRLIYGQLGSENLVHNREVRQVFADHDTKRRTSGPLGGESSIHKERTQRSSLGKDTDAEMVKQVKSSIHLCTGTETQDQTVTKLEQTATSAIDDALEKSAETPASADLDLDESDEENNILDDRTDNYFKRKANNHPNQRAPNIATIGKGQENDISKSPCRNTASGSSLRVFNINTTSNANANAVSIAAQLGFDPRKMSATQSPGLNSEAKPSVTNSCPPVASSQREVLEDSQQDLFSQESSQSCFHPDKNLLDSFINNRTLHSQSAEPDITPSDPNCVSDPTRSHLTQILSHICHDREDISSPAEHGEEKMAVNDSVEITAITGRVGQNDHLESKHTHSVNTLRVPQILGEKSSLGNTQKEIGSADIKTPASSETIPDSGSAADDQPRTLLFSRSVKLSEAASNTSLSKSVHASSAYAITSITVTAPSDTETPSLMKIPVSSTLTPQSHRLTETQIPFTSAGLNHNIQPKVLCLPSLPPVQSFKPHVGVISPSSTVASSDIFPVSCREMVKKIETKLEATNKNSKEYVTERHIQTKFGPSMKSDHREYEAIPICHVEELEARQRDQIGDVSKLPTFLLPSCPSMSRPAVKTDLKTLVENGVLRPGQDVLSLCNKGKIYRASLDKKGCIVASGGERFRTPNSWYGAITGIVTCRRQQAYNKVLYKGRPLSVYEAGIKQGTVPSETTSSKSNKGGYPGAQIPAKESKILKETSIHLNSEDLGVSSRVVNVSLCNTGSQVVTASLPGVTKLGASQGTAHQIPNRERGDNKGDMRMSHIEKAASEEEKRLAGTLKESLCRVYLIADTELLACPELGDRFWTSEFKDVHMSESLWYSVSSWD